jgi:hypothetical protein
MPTGRMKMKMIQITEIQNGGAAVETGEALL